MHEKKAFWKLILMYLKLVWGLESSNFYEILHFCKTPEFATSSNPIRDLSSYWWYGSTQINNETSELKKVASQASFCSCFFRKDVFLGVSKNYTPLKLTARPWKVGIGRRSFPFEAYLQGRTVSFRKCISWDDPTMVEMKSFGLT